MGVLSKALRFAILGSIILGGCAVSPSSKIKGGGDLAALSADDSAVAASEQQGDSGPAVGGPEMIVTESTDLLPADGSSAEGLGLRMERGSGFSRFVVSTVGPEPTFDIMKISDPARLVIDLIGQPRAVNASFPVANDGFVNGIRLGGHEDKTRLVFDIKDNASHEHTVDAQAGNLVITFVEPGLSPSAQPVQADVSPALPEPADQGFAVAEVQEEELTPAKPAESETALELKALSFVKDARTPGEVTLQLTQPAAFELKQSAQTEYVVTIPGATAQEATTVPQIAPKDFPGIRSVRAVQRGNDILVRMFVDPTVELFARPRDNSILITARSISAAAAPDARAQLAPEAPEAAPADAGAAEDEKARENPTGIPSADGSKVYTGRLISLDLQDTDIDNALRIIAEVSNLNIIASDDVSGKVTLRLIDVPWDQALDVILKTNGLDQITEGNVIRIAPVDKLRQEAEALREAKRAQENLEDLNVRYIRVSYARAEDIKEAVETVLTERGTVTTDDRTNQLVVRDIKKGLDAAEELIAKLDLRTPQVLLETQIVEATRGILRDLGFQWNFTYIQSPETGNATGMNFPNSIAWGGNGPDGNAVNFPATNVGETGAGAGIGIVMDSADGSRSLAARLTALETESMARVISRPQVATVNNKQAEIKSVETMRIRLPDSGTSIGIGAGSSAAGGGQTAVEEIDVGIELLVTPQASPDYYVLLDVMAKSSTFSDQTVADIPNTIEREANSTILVKSGQTFALGGVYRIEDSDSVDGVPWLKDLPFLGWAFRHTLTQKQDVELIFFITPHIVEGSFDSELMVVKGGEPNPS